MNNLYRRIELELMQSYVNAGDTRAEYKAKAVASRIVKMLELPSPTQMPTDEEIEKEAEIHSEFKGYDGKINNNIAKQVSFKQGAKWFKSRLSDVPEVNYDEIEKQLLDRFAFNGGIVDAENQVKIFSFMDWLKGKSVPEVKASDEVCYFIERKSDNKWYSTFCDWTINPNEANKFKTTEDANDWLDLLKTIAKQDKLTSYTFPECDITEHLFISPKDGKIGTPKEPVTDERFKKPTDKELVEISLLFNDGKIQQKKLRDMIAMCEFIIDRLYENGNISKPSSRE